MNESSSSPFNLKVLNRKCLSFRSLPSKQPSTLIHKPYPEFFSHLSDLLFGHRHQSIHSFTLLLLQQFFVPFRRGRVIQSRPKSHWRPYRSILAARVKAAAAWPRGQAAIGDVAAADYRSMDNRRRTKGWMGEG
ncbi:hypothetical protein L596_022504 [Steinernema carpocapsae]|uniref:Uncharacterized protein n=1 Tax=Steinernema carpocapsae TaxID=34508 RepID=A0A4U5MLU9_STECR|nr:hypothetical protein L596_022504 [Steinernema carpocapsae]